MKSTSGLSQVIAHGRVCRRTLAMRESPKFPDRRPASKHSGKKGLWLDFETMDFSHVENPQSALSQILFCSLAGNAKI
jgi:hypothetical protein